MTADWAIAIAAMLSAIAAMYAAHLSSQNGKKLKVPGNGATIGEQIGELKRQMTKIAEEKVIADAKLTAAALSAIAKLSAGKDMTIQEVAELAADKVTYVADVTAAELKVQGPKL